MFCILNANRDFRREHGRTMSPPENRKSLQYQRLQHGSMQCSD
jgi:hypothetical protein